MVLGNFHLMVITAEVWSEHRSELYDSNRDFNCHPKDFGLTTHVNKKSVLTIDHAARLAPGC